MKEPIDISFKAINSGVGFSSSVPKSFSYYEKSSTELALDSEDVFENLLDSPDFYDQLEKRLEKPILDSLSPKKKPHFKTTPSTLQKQTDKPEDSPYLSLTSTESFQEQESPLNVFFMPPFSALRIDLTFTLGLYMLGGVLSAVLFGISNMPSWVFILLGYGVFHQIYLIVCRSLMRCSLGEERCNIGWNTKSFLPFVLRGLISIFTGFVLLPICSVLFRKDLLEECTGLRLRYNI